MSSRGRTGSGFQGIGFVPDHVTLPPPAEGPSWGGSPCYEVIPQNHLPQGVLGASPGHPLEVNLTTAAVWAGRPASGRRRPLNGWLER